MKTLLIITITSFLLQLVALSEDLSYVKEKIYVVMGTPDKSHADGSITLFAIRVYLPGSKEPSEDEKVPDDCYLLDAPAAYKEQAQNSKLGKEVKCIAKYVGLDIWEGPGGVKLKTPIFRFIRDSK